jgi:DNA ligase-1
VEENVFSLSPLYSRTETGAIQVWTIEVEGNKFRTISGQLDGKKITSEWTVCFGKNSGKKNATSDSQQAATEAKAKWKKKLESGYRESIDQIDQRAFIEPMLAKNYEDYSQDIKFPVFSQPKYDGIRCVVDTASMRTRNGKAIVSAPHVQQALQQIFAKFPNLVLDGELYCDKLANDFNKICSLVKKTKPAESDLAESAASIQYWIYDIADASMSFSERTAWISANIKQSDCIKVVPTETVDSTERLDALYSQYMNDGYEGQMVRLDGKYEFKRSRYLLKRKEFVDEEFEILGLIEGEGNKTGMAGSMIFKNAAGTQFNSNIKGDRDYLRGLLQNSGSLVGKQATVKYFNLTPDGVPRFPYVVAIRDYE